MLCLEQREHVSQALCVCIQRLNNYFQAMYIISEKKKPPKKQWTELFSAIYVSEHIYSVFHVFIKIWQF